MKYKLLSIENKPVQNIGDYVQALAAAQFLPHVDGFVNRESLSDYDGDECKVIMNGWYMHDPTKWPPSEKIYPLFVSLHINKLASEQMLKEEGLKYLKEHEPIGCRDYYTRDLLQARGVDAYFSGCLTLTLGRSYRVQQHTDKVYFVDADFPRDLTAKSLLKDLFFIISNPFLVYKISKKLKASSSKIKNVQRVVRFTRIYSSLFNTSTLENAEYISQENERYAAMSNDERLKEAERLVKLYAQAGLVVTKRIHCALPCLGLETPVYFIRNLRANEISTCRFGGLENLFNTLTLEENSIKCDFNSSEKLSLQNVIKNKNDWWPLAEKLKDQCIKFVSPHLNCNC